MTEEGATWISVIPARDAEIQEFYQVGEHKSYVEVHHFYGRLDPSVKHWDDKRGYLDDIIELLCLLA